MASSHLIDELVALGDEEFNRVIAMVNVKRIKPATVTINIEGDYFGISGIVFTDAVNRKYMKDLKARWHKEEKKWKVKYLESLVSDLESYFKCTIK